MPQIFKILAKNYINFPYNLTFFVFKENFISCFGIR